MNAVLSLVARLSQIAAILISWSVKLGWRVVTRSPLEGPMMARELFERLGGSFLKFGQILSLQIDVLPKEYCDAFLSLLDQVPPIPREDVDRALTREIGGRDEAVGLTRIATGDYG